MAVVAILSELSGVHQGFLMKFYSSCASSLITVHKCVYWQKAMTWIRCGFEANIWQQLHAFHLNISWQCIFINWKWCHKPFFVNWWFFWQSWTVFSNSFIRPDSTAARTFVTHGLDMPDLVQLPTHHHTTPPCHSVRHLPFSRTSEPENQEKRPTA